MNNRVLIACFIVFVLVVGVGAFILLPKGEDEEMQKKLQALPTQNQSVTTVPQRTFSVSEVANHATKSDCWLIIEGKVYDVTSFISEHPGGDEILKGCGKDATTLFEGEHEHQENNATSYLPQFMIGTLQ